MRTPSLPDCCPLCDGAIYAPDMTKHLRTMHQVMPGEATIADVPTRGAESMRPVPARLDATEHLVEVGAA